MFKRVVIADDEPIIRMDLSEVLTEAGYKVVGQASDGFDAIEICRDKHPDLVILDVKMPLLDGLKAAKIITEEGLASAVVLLTAYSDDEFIEEAKMAGAMNYLIKPFDEEKILPSLEMAISKGEEIKKLKGEIHKTKQSLEARKVVEKAKGLLMDKYKMTEDEAYKKIRKLSMDKGCTMAKIAEILLLNED